MQVMWTSEMSGMGDSRGTFGREDKTVQGKVVKRKSGEKEK